MARQRLQKTFADYVAIAISPVLIMLLVGSLVLFLLEIGYDGRYPSRLRWILFWFVVASVLVARISIENSPGAARVYGLGLALAVSLVIFKFVDSFVLGALCLLGVVWWCTDKLTWDCTLIDDTQDASGEGLLQAAGMEEDAGSSGVDSWDDTEQDSSSESDETTAAGTERVPLWQTMLLNRSESSRKPHTPGLWVVYFSLAALPLFGLGQLLIPAGDAEGREFAFRLLWIYVASALGLLLTTSFLGLRRYLRQRNVEMPASISGLWIGMGGGLILVILLFCVLLPRPEADYSLTAMIDQVSSKMGDASRIAFLDDDHGKGDGQRTGDTEDENEKSEAGDKDRSGDGSKKGSQNAKSGSAQGEGKKSGQGTQKGKKGGKGKDQGKGSGKKNGKQGAGEKGKKQQGEKQQGEKTKNPENGSGENENEQQQAENGGQQSSSPPSSSPISKLGNGVKWVLYVVLGVVLLYFLIRHWSALVATLKQLWGELVNFWNDLFNRKPKERAVHAVSDDVVGTASYRRPFSAFRNPFTSGLAQQMMPEELVCYTFEALEAWACEQHLERQQDQTPLEFARLIEEKISIVSKDVSPVAKLYARVAYADYTPSIGSLGSLEQLWRRLGSE